MSYTGTHTHLQVSTHTPEVSHTHLRSVTLTSKVNFSIEVLNLWGQTLSVHVNTADRQTDSEWRACRQTGGRTDRQTARPESMDAVNGSGHVLPVIDVGGFWVEDLKEECDVQTSFLST